MADSQGSDLGACGAPVGGCPARNGFRFVEEFCFLFFCPYLSGHQSACKIRLYVVSRNRDLPRRPPGFRLLTLVRLPQMAYNMDARACVQVCVISCAWGKPGQGSPPKGFSETFCAQEGF